MKRVLRVTTALSTVWALTACGSGIGTDMGSFTDSSSYAMGLDIGNTLENMNADLDLPSLLKGLSDILEEKEPLLTPEQAADVLQLFAQRMQEKAVEDRTDALTRNSEEGAAFLAENGEKDGVMTTESGLQYEVMTEGDGPTPTAMDRVTVHYLGTLIDGTKFDSSYDRGQPATFAVTGVIAGWTEALQLMKVGGKYRLFVPSELAYGEGGSGPVIEPNATLIFEVELLSID